MYKYMLLYFYHTDKAIYFKKKKGIFFLVLLMFGGLISHGSTGKVSKHEDFVSLVDAPSRYLSLHSWRSNLDSRSAAPRLVEAPSSVQKVIWRLSPMKNKCWNQHLVVGFIHSIFFSCCQGFWSNPYTFFQALWLDRRLRGEMLWCEATSGAHFLRQTWRKMPLPALPQTPYWRSLWHLCPHFIPCSWKTPLVGSPVSSP